MAYISTEEVAAIRKQLKAEMPEYKFSVKKNHHSSVTVAFMKGPAFEGMDDHEQLNHYHAEKFYGKKNAAIINKVEKIIKTAPATVQGGREWFDESDSMTDYFHTAFYMSIHVGQWDKPYQAV
jgi:hypothetical protein